MKDSLEKANTEQRVFSNSDTRRMVRVKSWDELAECGRPIRRANRKETDIHPPKKNDTTVCLFIHDMRELCSKVVEIDGDGVELKTGDGWDLSPWMYEELETPDPRAEEQGDKAIKIRVRSWKELLKCRTPSPDPASPYYLNEQIMALCNKVFEVVLEDDGRAIIEGWSIQPWMYEELDSAASTPEPPPKHNDHRPVYYSLIEAIHERAKFGLEKHGTHLKPHNGRNAMTDALQESLDMNFYLMQKVVELEEQLESVKKLCREKGGDA